VNNASFACLSVGLQANKHKQYNRNRITRIIFKVTAHTKLKEEQRKMWSTSGVADMKFYSEGGEKRGLALSANIMSGESWQALRNEH